jgi:hypothetical protein
MPHQDVMDRELPKGIVDRKDRSAGISEDSSNSLADERGPENFGSG